MGHCQNPRASGAPDSYRRVAMKPRRAGRSLPPLAIALLAGLSFALGPRAATGDGERDRAGDAAAGGFAFVQMCDTQLGMGGYEHDVRSFELAVDQINALEPDFVLICGDLVDKADDKSFADFNRIRAKFKIPCHCAAGNHDVENRPTAASLQRYRKKIGEDYFTVEHKGYTFVVANTQLWKAPLEGESEKHDAWFRKSLARAKARGNPVVVVTHYPLFVQEPDEEESYFNIGPAKRGELLALCEENGVVALLAGHTHRLVVKEYKGMQMVNGETTSKNFDGRPLGFRWWDASADGTLSHRFVELKGM